MVKKLDEFDCNAVRSAMRELADAHGMALSDFALQRLAPVVSNARTADPETYKDLLELGDSALTECVAKFVNFISVREKYRDCIALAALEILYEDRELLGRRLQDRSPALIAYLTDILVRAHRLGKQLAGKRGNAILEGWQKGGIASSDVLLPAIYQVYRRHKPVPDASDPRNHTIVTELVQIDTLTRSCLLIDSDGKVHEGTLHINSDKLAFFLYQRPLDVGGDFEYRYYCMQLEGRMTLYPSLCVRIGDVTGRPAMSECLAVHVSRKNNPELYKAVKAIAEQDSPPRDVANDPVVMDYIAPAPKISVEQPQRPLKYIKDFPFFANIIELQSGTLKRFQEPIRPLDKTELFSVLQHMQNLGVTPPRVFRHSES